MSLPVIWTNPQSSGVGPTLPTVPLASIEVPLRAAAGCVAAADLIAHIDYPQVPIAQWDGYAVRTNDRQRVASRSPRLRVVDRVTAGFVSDVEVSSLTTVAVQRGSVLPLGADAVVPCDDGTGAVSLPPALAADLGTEVAIGDVVSAGDGVVAAASEWQAGQVVIGRGEVLNSEALALLARVGCQRVTVHPRPRVCVISVADDVVPLAGHIVPGLRYDEVAIYLLSELEAAGAHVGPTAVARCSVGAVADKIRDAQGCADVVILIVAEYCDPAIPLAALEDLGGVGRDIGWGPCATLLARNGQESVLVAIEGTTQVAKHAMRETITPVLDCLAGRTSGFNTIDLTHASYDHPQQFSRTVCAW